jgi:hypothetical protein
MADDAGAAPLSAEDVQKRERLRSVLTSLIGEVHVKLSHLRYTIETLQSLADIKVRIENGKKKKKKKIKKNQKKSQFFSFHRPMKLWRKPLSTAKRCDSRPLSFFSSSFSHNFTFQKTDD